MEFINPISAIIAVIVAIFSIPKSLHSINEFRRKKFKDELENYKEYFEKFYNCEKNIYPKLLQDKAAQNITRTQETSAYLVNYFIDLHEKNLVNFDKVTEHYHWGNRFIHIDDQDSTIIFKPKTFLSKRVCSINYFLYAFFIGISIFIFLGKINLFNVEWLNNFLGIANLILGIACLRTADDMHEALKFLKSMNPPKRKLSTRDEKLNTLTESNN
ncbi:hypothetical protein [Acinetobacter sp. NIPH 2699]|uniref:hypothetical protein n=1 Tax=Acinetobacter sp. NIPH 2699 TaxID=2923433 RepID=UPI001F4B030D|nr:hypothetical protein [Acinetobacter sp. NIPH 2699]MCH7336681.1 hypothetical protein [Acinetobacter sp. NIPH 2699]